MAGASAPRPGGARLAARALAGRRPHPGHRGRPPRGERRRGAPPARGRRARRPWLSRCASGSSRRRADQPADPRAGPRKRGRRGHGRRQPRPQPRRVLRSRARHRPFTRKLRGALGRPRPRRRLHRAPERPLHVEWSQRAIEAGKHVLCEKPLGDGPEEVEALFDLAEEKRLVLAEGFMYRHNPQTRRLDGLVTEAIGRLQLVRASFTFLLEREPSVRLDPGLGGGSVLDLGAYCVSGARLLAGEPETVVGQQVLGPPASTSSSRAASSSRTGCSASSTAGCERPFVPSSKPSAPKVHSLWTTLALQQPGHRASHRRRHRANPSPDGGLVPARAGGFRPRRGRGGPAAPGPGGRRGPGAGSRRPAPLGGRMRSGQGLSFEVSATRKSEPFTRWSVWSWSFDQRGSGRRDVPARAVVGDDHPVALERTEDDPAWWGKLPTLKSERSRSQAHGRKVSCRCSSRRSGGPGRRRRAASCTVKRRAWSISPLATSS